MSISISARTALAVALAIHCLLLALGIFVGGWLLVAFHLVTDPAWIGSLMRWTWLIITLSPLLGLAALELPSLRKAYFVCAALVPIFLAVTLGMPEGFFGWEAL